jgi:hypothetical protein
VAAHRGGGFEDAPALFPNLYVGKDAFYSATALKDIKKEMEVKSGVRFQIRDLRPTLTSITVNGDMGSSRPCLRS